VSSSLAILPAVHPWPSSISEVDSHLGLLKGDTAADCWSQPNSLCFRTLLTDLSELVPGPYTVFAKDNHGGDALGTAMFRGVVEVEAGRRHPVPVRFTGEEARPLPW
jgi:hypothetical protein